MKSFARKLSTLVGVTALIGATVVTAAIAQQQAEPSSAISAKPEIGGGAPDFKLTDLNGNTHKLSQYKGKTVVLMWFSPECPFVVKHFADKSHQTFNNLYNEFHDKGVVFLAINSANASHSYANVETNKKAVKDWNFQWPVLMDTDGKVGKAYNAKRTPEMFIINAEGNFVYYGAIDDDGSPKGPGSLNYVHQALTEHLAGETISTPKTQPYGCSVKY